MKRNLLFAAAMLCGLAANAQEYAIIDGAGLGLNTETAIDVAAGTTLASTANVTLTTAFDDTYKIVSVNGPKDADGNSYKYFVVNGTVINSSDSGVQGQTNPVAANDAKCPETFEVPVKGAVCQFDVTANGYLYVFHKASSNKQYMAYEYSNPLAYSFAQLYGDGDPQIASYELEGDADGYISLTSYPSGIQNVQTITGMSATSQNGCSVIKIPVYDQCRYWVFASGSKISVLGYYFDTTGDATIAVSSDESGSNAITLMGSDTTGDTTGIQSVAVEAAAENAAAYNLAGQQVTDSYKGVVIKGGKKYINK